MTLFEKNHIHCFACDNLIHKYIRVPYIYKEIVTEEGLDRVMTDEDTIINRYVIWSLEYKNYCLKCSPFENERSIDKIEIETYSRAVNV